VLRCGVELPSKLVRPAPVGSEGQGSHGFVDGCDTEGTVEAGKTSSPWEVSSG
jgi:hypothetical protein